VRRGSSDTDAARSVGQNALVITSPPVVAELGLRLARLGWVTDLFVGGSVATGDYLPRISDLDLVALTDGPVDEARQAVLTTLHRGLDEGTASGLNLGCVYVDSEQLRDLQALHPTWTPGKIKSALFGGEGLFFAGQNHVAIQIVSAPFEHEIITSNPEERLKKQQADEAAKEKNVYVNGRSLEHTGIAPDNLVTNIIEKWGEMYGTAGTQSKAGTVGGKFERYGLDTKDCTGAELSYKEGQEFNSLVPPEVVAELQELKKKFATGALKVSVTPEDARGGVL